MLNEKAHDKPKKKGLTNGWDIKGPFGYSLFCWKLKTENIIAK